MAYLTAAERARQTARRSQDALRRPFWRLQLTFVVLALAGLAISGYLSVTHLLEKTIACGGVGDCDYVNASEYAYILGVPVAVLGLAMYGALLAIALRWYTRPASEIWPIVYWGAALSGAGYAGYLTYVELDVLHAICVWCMASATVLLVSLALSTVMLLRADESTQSAP